MTTSFFECGRYRFSLKPAPNKTFAKPIVMGILNVTPDSFSDGGLYHSLDHAISHAEHMIEQGVDIIDIGGESSRPGAVPLALQEELDRVIPLIYALRDCGKPLSIDTYKPEVMKEAILAGVDMVNDIRGFHSIASRETVANSDVGLCVMHMKGLPSNMQIQVHYDDIEEEVLEFLEERCTQLIEVGVEKGRICVDPGFGFGKTLEHNLVLVRAISRLRQTLGLPVLAGLSRKSMIGTITGQTVERRMAGSLGAAIAAYSLGAQILRVHDVAETIDALKVWQTMTAK